MPKSLLEERDKNLFKSNIILYTMILFALLFPIIVFELTEDLFITFIFGIGALFYILSITNAIDTTFSSMDAKKLDSSLISQDIKLRQFKNLVEELKLSAGYPGKIDLYLIRHPSINAMAVSRGNKAAIAITTGALEKLNREELSGVVAHEISHIVNADSDVKLTAYVTMGVLYTYAYLALRGGRFLLGGRKKKGEGIVILLIILVAVMGYILGLLMFFAISRRREKLADIEAVRFTRDKYALINALKKIKKNEVLKVSDTASALFFANPLDPKKSRAFFNTFKTHPPINERIKYLEEL